MSIPVLPFLTSTYSRSIMWGTERLSARDNYGGVAEGYYIPVETYIAQHYSITKVNEALVNNFLNQQEHDEIIAILATVPKLQVYE